ncbi:MAG: TM2 domain-containing protein [Clostridia bacterium]|nr:TM2 domain-containing protein [Clostridia bacterium]
MKCKNCGADVGSEYRLCPYCRSELDYPVNNSQPQTIIIQNVIPNQPQPQYYNQPPQPQYQNQPPQPVYYDQYASTKNKYLALVLCIFLGFFGVHRFYVGKVGSGLVYFFTVGIFCFGWIYDIIKIASGTFNDGNGLPLI